jgi:hypothetical protein
VVLRMMNKTQHAHLTASAGAQSRRVRRRRWRRLVLLTKGRSCTLLMVLQSWQANSRRTRCLPRSKKLPQRGRCLLAAAVKPTIEGLEPVLLWLCFASLHNAWERALILPFLWQLPRCVSIAAVVLDSQPPQPQIQCKRFGNWQRCRKTSRHQVQRVCSGGAR